MAAFSMIGSGIPSEEQLFWQSFPLEELHSLYMAINATPGKVLALHQEPTLVNESEGRVFHYLQQFVWNLNYESFCVLQQAVQLCNGRKYHSIIQLNYRYGL